MNNHALRDDLLADSFLRDHVAQLIQSISQLAFTTKQGRSQGEKLVVVLAEGLRGNNKVDMF